jgi:hypothetical protein
MAKALELERAVIAGTAAERTAAVAIARDVADHQRALLRDVICGHLTPDLARLADELLAAPEHQPAAPAAGPAVDAHNAEPVAARQQVLVEA